MRSRAGTNRNAKTMKFTPRSSSLRKLAMRRAAANRLASRRQEDWAGKIATAWLRSNGVKFYCDIRRAHLWRICALAVFVTILSCACGIGAASMVTAAHHSVNMAQPWYRLMTWEPHLP